MKKIIPMIVVIAVMYFFSFLWNAYSCRCAEFNIMEWDPSKRDFGICVVAIAFFIAIIDKKK
jgi:hypothetical protein